MVPEKETNDALTNFLDILFSAGRQAEEKEKTDEEICAEHESCADCPKVDECIPFTDDKEEEGDYVFEIEVDDDGAHIIKAIRKGEEESCDEDNPDNPDCEDCWGYGIPCVDRVIFSGPATIVIFSDGSKSIVKCMEGEKFERYAGFCAAIMKRLFGSTSAAKALMDECDAAKIAEAREAEREAEREAKKAEKREREEREKAEAHEAFIEAVADEIYARMIEAEADRMMSVDGVKKVYRELTGVEEKEKQDEASAD